MSICGIEQLIDTRLAGCPQQPGKLGSRVKVTDPKDR